jgi:hypothetical protein
LEAFPCQPQSGWVQESSSFPKSSLASFSESGDFAHFLWSLMGCPPRGHSKTTRYAWLMTYDTTFRFEGTAEASLPCTLFWKLPKYW